MSRGHVPDLPEHSQPHLPAASLGFYDLRLPESRVAQEISCPWPWNQWILCYYHYGSTVSQLLQRPFEEVLRSGDPGLSLLPLLGQRTLDKEAGNGRDRMCCPPTRPIQQKTTCPSYPAAHLCVPGSALHAHRCKPIFLVYRRVSQTP